MCVLSSGVMIVQMCQADFFHSPRLRLKQLTRPSVVVDYKLYVSWVKDLPRHAP
jgi:hypothetical protein